MHKKKKKCKLITIKIENNKYIFHICCFSMKYNSEKKIKNKILKQSQENSYNH